MCVASGWIWLGLARMRIRMVMGGRWSERKSSQWHGYYHLQQGHALHAPVLTWARANRSRMPYKCARKPTACSCAFSCLTTYAATPFGPPNCSYRKHYPS